jgi:hypothetical protein
MLQLQVQDVSAHQQKMSPFFDLNGYLTAKLQRINDMIQKKEDFFYMNFHKLPGLSPLPQQQYFQRLVER